MATDTPPKIQQRSSYEKPELRLLGSVSELTKAGYASNDEQKTQDCNPQANSRCVNA
jgi:hypothetical protein